MADLKHFVRIANTDLDGKRSISYALPKIRGIGYNFAMAICNVLNIDINKKTGYLTEEEIKSINDLLKNPDRIPVWMYNRKKDIETGKNRLVLGADLKLNQEFDIKRQKKIKSYVGIRHASGQPVRGQRTRSNFRKGSAVGVVKKKMVKSEKSDKK